MHLLYKNLKRDACISVTFPSSHPIEEPTGLLGRLLFVRHQVPRSLVLVQVPSRSSRVASTCHLIEAVRFLMIVTVDASAIPRRSRPITYIAYRTHPWRSPGKGGGPGVRAHKNPVVGYVTTPSPTKLKYAPRLGLKYHNRDTSSPSNRVGPSPSRVLWALVALANVTSMVPETSKR